ncbi:NADH-ubiquinone oxidoreductase-F iron-sulfur binding region domain-containing protein [Actinospica sp.]|jgi:NADH:ubiquinone oxidoreductase subunit F (NADH-binding)|uniref:NADH-ubiquinone oxidoreductase-F iron-sulfur binding region domain-containing protein n=1 Tax=Actinospica sp. TaxID=1872142 RepID=UPI002CAB4B42|nr:NADH-ubiquinone oxidoreductase-F iron-sulfur binding region domain-containing protein [Actinospica sp.]HWG28751.1 NADH-ubiquinone oxidoreductase-F iron-sulfur binding region domain-containing protein [Actinospica sp.]
MTATDNATETVVPQTRHAEAGLLPTHPLNSAEHRAYYGALPDPGRLPLGELAALLGHAGVRGRGGAGFPLYRKIVSVSGAARARRIAPTIIANGCEGEPASHKDKHLLWLAPHLVLDGLVLLGRELRATRAILAVEAGAPNGRGDLVRRLRDAVKERDVRHDGVSIELAEVPGRFIAGESAALVSTLNGGPGMPSYTEHSVRERGVGGAPTLVQNVETVAQVALIARYGADWFRGYGTAAEPGPQLFTVYPGRNRPRVVHSAAGARLWPLISDAEPVEAVLIGGYHGSWIPAPPARQARLTEAELGVPLGAGLIAALPNDRCGLAETAHLVRYLALESAGQCGPCLNGLPRIAAALEQLADPRRAARDQGLVERLERWCGMIEGRGLCHHPDGSARLVRSALMTFRTEIAAHRAGLCTGGDRRPLLPTPTRELVH